MTHRQAMTACSKALLCALLVAVPGQTQLAKGATKFLGNITTNGAVRSDYLQYWNQITGENESKWSSVEGTRNVMNWAGTDRIAAFAKTNGIPWKFHTLVWGSQYPGEPNTSGLSDADAWQKKMTSGWLMQLSKADQLAEITQWYDEAAKRYPDVPMIDVVNEAYMSDPNDPTKGKHAPVPFREALGGTGTTGFDWIVTSFKMARARWPKAILIYNDYNTLEWGNEITWIKSIIPKLIAAGAPIDAVGFQAHGLKGTSAATLQTRLDEIAAAIKVPMYITEYDIGDTNDQIQLDNYKAHFPVMWKHPKVAGITLWGYITGATWVQGTGLMSSSNVERPAMTWLRSYVAANLNPPAPSVGPSVVPVVRKAFKDTVSLPGTVQVENYDLGGAGVAYYDTDAANNGGLYRTTEGVDIAGDSVRKSYALGWTAAGEWLEYTVKVAQAGTLSWSGAVATSADGSKFHLELDGKALTGSVAVPNTGSYNTYVKVGGVTTSALSAGTHVLRLAIDAGPFNIDSLTFFQTPVGVGGKAALAAGLPGRYEVHDMRGVRLGQVEVHAGRSLEAQLESLVSKPTLVVVRRPEDAQGTMVRAGF